MITLTKAAIDALREKLAHAPAGARARIELRPVGCKCKGQHFEGSIRLCCKHAETDQQFDIDGIPCVMRDVDYRNGQRSLRIGLAGLEE